MAMTVLLMTSPGNLLFLAVAVLLPLVPAYILYRVLPAESQVEGPWQGLRIKLGGAFAGYFLVFITLLSFSLVLPTYEVWTVRGQVQLSDRDARFSPATLRFAIEPPALRVNPDGRFEVTVIRTPNQAGLLELPDLIVGHPVAEANPGEERHPGYRDRVLYLDEDGTKNRLRRMVTVEPVVLEPLPRSGGNR